jgi:hypothetical protein
MSYFNEDQQGYMRYLATVPRNQRCASGWHVGTERCDCGPYQPCAISGCLRSRHHTSELYCYEDTQLNKHRCKCGHSWDEHERPTAPIPWDICSFPCTACDCTEFDDGETLNEREG